MVIPPFLSAKSIVQIIEDYNKICEIINTDYEVLREDRYFNYLIEYTLPADVEN